jgi:hypothetical protein
MTGQLVHLRLDRQLHAAVTRAAQARGRKASEWMRDTLAAALGMCPTCGGMHQAEAAPRTQKKARAEVAA